jgi:hypothetical protein
MQVVQQFDVAGGLTGRPQQWHFLAFFSIIPFYDF